MKGLIYLYLSENDLTSLSPDAFKGFSEQNSIRGFNIHLTFSELVFEQCLS